MIAARYEPAHGFIWSFETLPTILRTDLLLKSLLRRTVELVNRCLPARVRLLVFQRVPPLLLPSLRRFRERCGGSGRRWEPEGLKTESSQTSTVLTGCHSNIAKQCDHHLYTQHVSCYVPLCDAPVADAKRRSLYIYVWPCGKSISASREYPSIVPPLSILGKHCPATRTHKSYNPSLGLSNILPKKCINPVGAMPSFPRHQVSYRKTTDTLETIFGTLSDGVLDTIRRGAIGVLVLFVVLSTTAYVNTYGGGASDVRCLTLLGLHEKG